MAEASKIEYRERPILFSAPMVRALQDGRKTQTRRIASIPLGWAPEDPPVLGRITSPHQKKGRFGVFARRGLGTDFPEADLIPCPYGQPGDRLWVREAFALDDNGHEEWPVFRADGAVLPVLPPTRKPARWKSATRMPRWASRITLEITGVRVERLNDCSDADALAEGVDRTNTSISGYAQERYRRLWESLNGEKSWDVNPWVWVIEFRRLTA